MHVIAKNYVELDVPALYSKVFISALKVHRFTNKTSPVCRFDAFALKFKFICVITNLLLQYNLFL